MRYILDGELMTWNQSCLFVLHGKVAFGMTAFCSPTLVLSFCHLNGALHEHIELSNIMGWRVVVTSRWQCYHLDELWQAWNGITHNECLLEKKYASRVSILATLLTINLTLSASLHIVVFIVTLKVIERNVIRYWIYFYLSTLFCHLFLWAVAIGCWLVITRS